MWAGQSLNTADSLTEAFEEVGIDPYALHLARPELDRAWIERLKPRRAILTNLHSDLDYEKLRTRLPAHVEPAYDGVRVSLPVADIGNPDS